MKSVITYIIPWSLLLLLWLGPVQKFNSELSIIWSKKTLLQLLEDNCRREEWRPPYQLNVHPYICDSRVNATKPSTIVNGSPQIDSSEGSNIKNERQESVSSDIPTVSDVPNKSHTGLDNIVDVLGEGGELKDDSMPSFQEWKKRMLSEGQAKGENGRPGLTNPGDINKNNQPIALTNLKGSPKRARNYASYECGAKVIASNPEAEGTSRILNEMMDEYLLNPCKAHIWFIIELCESLQPLTLELANYELFSSTPKDFIVYGSDHYPTRDWTHLGSFTAMDVRSIQRFDLESQSRFLKYIKVEMNSHHGYEHYCPLSVIRLFGTSLAEEFDAIENGNGEKKFHYNEELEEEGTLISSPSENLVDSSQESSSKPLSSTTTASSPSHPANLIGTAREAVMNMVRKAAMALSNFPTQEIESYNKSDTDPLEEQRTVDVLKLSLSSIKLMPWLEKRLKKCKDCSRIDDGNPFSSANNSSPNQKLCDYVKSLLGLKTYAILCEEVNKEPLLRFRCPLLSYFLNTTNTFGSSGGPDELTFKENLVPSYPATNVLQDTNDFTTRIHESIDSSTQSSLPLPASVPPSLSSSPSYGDQQSVTHNLIVETVSPTSVIDGSVLSSITSVLIEPNHHNESGNLELSELVTDLVTNNVTSPDLNNTQNLSDQLVDSSFINKGSEEALSSSSSVPSSPSQQSLPPSSLPLAPQQQQQQQQLPSTPPTPSSIPSNAANWVPLSASQQKESVFIRMSNKIKALEVNLSLSSQYLEELSQRYRKNMDEMQRAFNRTITKLNETARVATEKDDKQQEMLELLESRLTLIDERVALLVAEKETMHWHFIEIHIILLIIEIIIMVSIMSLCVKRAAARLEERYRYQNDSVKFGDQDNKRISYGSLKRPNPSPETFNPSPAKSKRIEEEELIIVQPSFPLSGENFTSKNKKKRKKKNRSLEVVGGDYDENRTHSKSSENLTMVSSGVGTTLSKPKDYLRELNLKAPISYKFDTDSNFIGFLGKPHSCDNIVALKTGHRTNNNSNENNRSSTSNVKTISKSNSSSSSGISSLSTHSTNRVLREKQVNRNSTSLTNQVDKDSLRSLSNAASTTSPTKSSFSWKKLLKLERK